MKDLTKQLSALISKHPFLNLYEGDATGVFSLALTHVATLYRDVDGLLDLHTHSTHFTQDEYEALKDLMRLILRWAEPNTPIQEFCRIYPELANLYETHLTLWNSTRSQRLGTLSNKKDHSWTLVVPRFGIEGLTDYELTAFHSLIILATELNATLV